MTQKGVEFEAVNYFKQPLTAAELGRLLRQAGIGPRDALRTKGPAYKELVAGKELSDAELLKLMAAHPELIQRPIVARGNRAVLARPAARLEELKIK